MFATLLTTASDTTLESSSPIVVAIYRAFKYSSSLGLDLASGFSFSFSSSTSSTLYTLCTFWYNTQGRILEPYFVEGKTTVRTIGASWTGDDNHPKADTAVPVRVYDQRYEQPQ